ncbi:MAG: response regulator [Myxococcota bacterium]|nr:response regulator [Myxococcota bacterium]
MVVDDDDDIRLTIAEALTDAGRQVLTARHGAEALEVLRGAGPLPQLILLDLMMPVMDGATFCEHRDADGRLRRIPVVVLSADAALAARCATLGVQGHHKKPIDLDTLYAVVARYC